MTDGLRPPLPILVVVPTSLLHTWIAEHKSHLLGLGLGKPVIAYGKNLDFYKAGKRRKDVDGGQPSLQTELLRSESWIITTYETLRDYQISFGKIRIAAAVFDEAQRIKNPGASLKNASKNMNADFFIAATGTPVENRLADLWSIVDLIEPDYLGSLRDFSRKYEGKDAADSVPELRQKVEHSPTTATSGLMLRRMKDGTLRGLPTKTEHFEKHVMNDVQAAAYDDAIAEARQVGKKSRDVLLALHGIRTVSLHPDVTASVPDHEYIAMSARYSSAFEILDRIHSAGEKALIFLESLDAQMPLALLIQRRYGLRERPMIINGEVPPGQRQERVSAFQAQSASFDVMILSPRAGGVGLTLTTANHVIHLSRWWNPAVEDQCTDRVYRIGQEKSVHVHYLQAVHPAHKEHSFDVRLNSLLQRKRSLSRDLLAPMIFTSDDARQLFADTVSNGPVEDSH
jgi:SNF2 family DNA or RNA helicase